MGGINGFTAVLCMLAAFAVPAAQADVFMFVDDDGTVNFTDTPAATPHVVYLKTKRADRGNRVKAVFPATYDRHVQAAHRTTGLQPRLIKSVIQAESAFNHRAVSPKGAMGLMQLMPQTARLYGVRRIFDPGENIAAGSRHLKMLVDRYDGDLKRALAAYNAGEKAVDKYNGVPPFKETRGYVKKVMALYNGAPYVPVQRKKAKVFRYVSSDGTVVLTDTPR